MSEDLPEGFASTIRSVEIAVPCRDLSATVAYFTDTLGFRLDQILPADAPRTALLSGYGVALRLERSETGIASGVSLRLHADGSHSDGASLPRELIAPNGMRIEIIDTALPLELPGEAVNTELVLTRASDDGWSEGRAGMQYRDLIPSRLGGRFIASHIRIPDGGTIPDYVHYHKVRFQLIVCRRGWVRVVYEDQGEPFVLEPGDCVLQPPEIRHRVLEASPGLEVVEIGCPAVHETWADHAMVLPNERVSTDRSFGGQRFVRHVASNAAWAESGIAGLDARDTGIAEATGGLACVRVLRPEASAMGTEAPRSAAEFHFLFVLAGRARIVIPPHGEQVLSDGDSCVLPGSVAYTISAVEDSELLEVVLPAAQTGDRPVRTA
jgi:quercetin dioxygenase-like cupin family protein